MITPKEHTKRLCLIPLCKNERFDLVHKFPMDNQRAEEWRRAINIPEINNLSLDLLRKRTICSKHFRKEDYKNVESRSLNKTAIPSLHFRNETISEKTNLDATVKSHVDDERMSLECQIIVHNGNQQAIPTSNSSTTNSDQLKLVRKYSCNVNRTTVFRDEGPPPKHCFVESNQNSKDFQYKNRKLKVIPVTKSVERICTTSLLPMVNVSDSDDSITLIDASANIAFISSENEANCIQNAEPYSIEIVPPLSSSCLSEYVFPCPRFVLSFWLFFYPNH